MTTRSRLDRMDQAREALLGQHPPRTPVAHEASGTTTSPQRALQAAGRPLNRSQRDALTGVPTDPSKQGWTAAVAAPHLCLPPRQYPQNCGPGSEWTCRCGAVWVARGIEVNPDTEHYGVSPDRNDTVLAVEQWFYRAGGNDVVCRNQEALYDWRPLGPYYVKLLRLMIDTAQGRDAGTMWQDLG
jgi:hypothetical protein